MAVWRRVPSFGITISLVQLLLFLCVASRCRNCSPCRSIRKSWADYECAYTRARWEFTAGSHCLPHSSESSWSADSFKSSWSPWSAEYLFTSRVKISGRLGFSVCMWMTYLHQKACWFQIWCESLPEVMGLNYFWLHLCLSVVCSIGCFLSHHLLQVLAEGLRSKVQLSQKVVAHITSDVFVHSFCILKIRVSLIVLCVGEDCWTFGSSHTADGRPAIYFVNVCYRQTTFAGCGEQTQCC